MADPRDSRVQSGNAELAVWEWGEPSQPPLLALHPGVGDRRTWSWCGPTWAAAGRRVVAYDRRGFGETTYETEPHSDLDDLRAVLDATTSTPAVVVGNSRGGGLALALTLAQPDRVQALVLMGAAPADYDYSNWVNGENEEAMDTLVGEADATGDLDRVNQLETHYWLDGTAQLEGRVTGEPRDLFLDMNGQALRAEPAGDAAPLEPTWDRLGDIAVPTLVIHGEHDLPGQQVISEQMTERMPNATMVTMENTAHCPSLDQPAALDALVLDFLAAL